MGRRRKNFIIENLEIIDISSEGKSVGKHEKMVVFVENCVPGDIVDVMVYRKKSSYAEARPIKFHQYSPHRIEAFCQHFGTCGGCKWQHLSYEQQLQYKQEQVFQNLKKIANIELPEIQLILPSPQTQYYRNKLEFTFTDYRWLTTEQINSEEDFERRGLGLHLPKKFDKVLDLEECYLQPHPSDAIRKALRNFAIQEDLEFFNIKEQKGFLRNLIIRTANTGDLMVLVQVFENKEDQIEKVMNFLQGQFPKITSLLYVVNSKGNETYNDLNIQTFAGKPYITETMEDLSFRVGAKSFYQTNSEQAYNLYKIAREFAQLSGEEVVYDLYTGTGTIANFVAKQAKEVIGIEYVPSAIEDAKVNSQINSIENTKFYAGDMKNILNKDFLKQHSRPDVIITDPPRAGMHQDVVETLLKVEAPKIVYVSCNVATQARDVALLGEKYEVKKIQPVDMFPHTYHVENVMLLEKR